MAVTGIRDLILIHQNDGKLYINNRLKLKYYIIQ